ncbi:hypothetical protein PRBRB14_21940 [Hallella multisaccharivorax DSM 17128]|uniref:Uncharacterized protein n=1 Tax=Hallella multisaccharivorax DSM 17128 TaxID=688246 RepID=F8N7I5_9BACT|nr:hypothetical protein [Hallella multisaccharivorax]EGN57445.1 hypothetical protein Premu_2051 [Hallella multisaccharivorax DSM 17128]GJG31315.1 hypothetical protein PRBRB14_21940 [Hallella multisaccharivorax DSM 17128]
MASSGDSSSLGCGALVLIVILGWLFTTFPEVMSTLAVIVVALIVVAVVSNKKKEKAKEERKLRPIVLYNNYPLFFQAYYYQNISKKPFSEDMINDSLNAWARIYSKVSDQRAEKWNNILMTLENFDKADHSLFEDFVKGKNVVPQRYFRNRSKINPIFLLPYESIETVTQNTVNTIIAEKKKEGIYQQFCKRYKKYLKAFLDANPALKTKDQILASEDKLKEYIAANQRYLSYMDWKDTQNSFCHETDAIVSTQYKTWHSIIRDIQIQGVDKDSHSFGDIVHIDQIAIKEYSDEATEDQSKADVEIYNWVKSLSFGSAHYNDKDIEAVKKFIKSITKGNKTLLVKVNDNFLGWNSQIVDSLYDNLGSIFEDLDYCDIKNLGSVLTKDKGEYKFIFLLDLISDEKQVIENSQDVMDLYGESMPVVCYLSMVRELTEEEVAEHIRTEKARRQRLLRYNDIVEQLPSGVSLWSVQHKAKDLKNKEYVVNAENEIKQMELSVASDDISSYVSYYLALGMGVKRILRKFPMDDEDDNEFSESDIMKSDGVDSLYWDENNFLAIELGGKSKFRAICFNGLSQEIVNEITSLKDNPFSLASNFDKFLNEVLTFLGLPTDYPWIVIDPKNDGVSIIVESGNMRDTRIETMEGYVNVQFLENRDNLFNSADFDSVQIKWNAFQKVPPSIDDSDRQCWFWNYSLPDTPPQTTSFTKIDELLYTYCSKVDYKPFDYQGTMYYLAIRHRIKDMWVNGVEKAYYVDNSKEWISTSETKDALNERGICLALGLKGFGKNPYMAKECFEKANNDEAKYNLASLIACEIIPGNGFNVNVLLRQIKDKMLYTNIIIKNTKKNYKIW